jgi:formamidopyrimidine-DNA glycosylase
MPELPEVQCVVNSLKSIYGKKVKNVVLLDKKLKEPVDEKLHDKLVNKEIKSIQRRGKFILFKFDDEYVVAHLGMTGKFLIQDKLIDGKHNRIVIQFTDNTYLVYNDIRKFGLFTHVKNKMDHKSIRKLGVEPLENNFTGKVLHDLASNNKMNVKVFLLDQSFVVGLGNIYVIELLYICKINPLSKAKDLSAEKCDELVFEIKKILNKSIELGGSSISDYRDAFDNEGSFQNSFNVYEKKKDPLGHDVLKIKQNGRGTYYCPICQPEIEQI